MELLLLIWLPLCIAVAILANRYNRSGLGWFCFALLLSPLLGFAFVLACGPRSADAARWEPEPTPVPTRLHPRTEAALRNLPRWQRRMIEGGC